MRRRRRRRRRDPNRARYDAGEIQIEAQLHSRTASFQSRRPPTSRLPPPPARRPRQHPQHFLRFQISHQLLLRRFATLPPILPPGPIGILGFGAGTAARIILEFYPEAVIHGWEIDPSVISVAREYFGLEKLEKKYADRLFINTGNALNSSVNGGFAGILIDLFSKGCVIPELQDPATWEKLRMNLRRGGRMMVNVGGSCVEPDDMRKDGSAIMEETLKAMHKIFPGEVSVLSIENRKDESSVALTGGFPESGEWKKVLRRPLKFYVDMWKPLM